MIMTEETYDNAKHMLNSYEDNVNGDHSIINKIVLIMDWKSN
jgi:hypothetical protein